MPHPATPRAYSTSTSAVLTETLSVPGGTVRRRSWVSAPAQALLVELTADTEFAASVALTTQLNDGAVIPWGGPHGLTFDIVAPGRRARRSTSPRWSRR